MSSACVCVSVAGLQTAELVTVMPSGLCFICLCNLSADHISRAQVRLKFKDESCVGDSAQKRVEEEGRPI